MISTTRQRIVVWAFLGAVALLLVGAALAVYLVWWLPNSKFRDLQWLENASPAEQKRVAEQVLRFPGNHHDAFLTLREHGDAASIPSLLDGLKQQGDTEPGGTMICTKKHGLDALRKITGHNAGSNYAGWKKWWDEEGSKLPPEAFPLKKGPAGKKPAAEESASPFMD